MTASPPPVGIGERAFAPRAPQLRKVRGSRRRRRAIDPRQDGGDDEGADDEGGVDDGAEDEAADDPPSVRVHCIKLEATSAAPVAPLATFWNGSVGLKVILMPVN